jgi:hypothetical protein
VRNDANASRVRSPARRAIFLAGGPDGPYSRCCHPGEPDAAAALADARNRAAVGRLVSRVLRPRSGPSALARAIAELKAEARSAGLTDADIDAELAACNSERLGGSAVD